MNEYLEQNNHPLNQASHRQLKKLKVKPDDQMIYSLQLAQAALGLRQSGLMRQDQADVEAMVEQLLSEPPEQAMSYLLTNSEGESVERDLLLTSQSYPPEKLGQLILHSINRRMRAELGLRTKT